VRALRRRLGKGATVEEYTNGAQICDAVADHGDAIACVLMDCEMPVMDGVTATRRLRAAGWRGVLIGVTGHAADGDASFIPAGADAVMPKPVNVGELLQVLADAAVRQAVAEGAEGGGGDAGVGAGGR
jgi:CheY-like chemotaxis protein